LSRHLVVLSLSVLALSLVAISAVGQSDDAVPGVAPPAADGAQVERGRYLVEGVAMCAQCHTPRNESGELLMNQWLKGAPVPVTTPDGYAKWAYKAPRIAGLPQHKAATPELPSEFVTLMTTGINRDGKPPLSPMPQFRMTQEDAEAIEAYLRSLD
jgi:mono/diheme cytochrome c family protein